MSPSVTPEELAAVGPVLQRLRWADWRTRAAVERQYGVQVLPLTFYSNVPSLDEVTNSFEYAGDELPYNDPSLFRPDVLNRSLDELSAFAGEFEPPADGDETSGVFYWRNTQFSFSDAMADWCVLRRARPRTVVEIGGGFSTLVTVAALARNGQGRIHCVEPFPRPFLRDDAIVTLDRRPAQQLTAEFLNDTLADGDVLFIDSTHTVKSGSDCLHIYLRLLPRLRRDVLVHVHDVFLPAALPLSWLRDMQIFWTEQYLLMAFLLDNPKAEVIYGSHYHLRMNRPRLEAFMGGKWPAGGGSLWFRYDGRPGTRS